MSSALVSKTTGRLGWRRRISRRMATPWKRRVRFGPPAPPHRGGPPRPAPQRPAQRPPALPPRERRGRLARERLPQRTRALHAGARAARLEERLAERCVHLVRRRVAGEHAQREPQVLPEVVLKVEDAVEERLALGGGA